MKKRLLVPLYDPGPTNALSSILSVLAKERNIETIVLSESDSSRKILDSKKIPYTTLKERYKLESLDSSYIEHLVRHVNPDLILTGAFVQSNLDRYFINAAKQNRKTSIAIFEGYTYSTVRKKDSEVDPKFKFNPNYLLILDEIAKEIMLREGFKPEQLVITGNPAHDELVEFKKGFKLEDSFKVRNDFNVKPDDFLISFLSQPLHEDMVAGALEDYGYTQLTVLSSLEEAISSELKLIREPVLVIRTHPRENLELTKSALKGKLKRVHFTNSYDTKNLIMASDLVTGMITNALIDAIYLDKDVVSLQPGLYPGKEDRLITNSLGLSVPVYDTKYISTTLKKFIDQDEIFKTRIKERRSRISLDGKATERTLNFIFKLLN